MNKTCLMFVLVLREGAGKEKGELDEDRLLLDCLHLIKNETRELIRYLY